jgi:hypothetical protein
MRGYNILNLRLGAFLIEAPEREMIRSGDRVSVIPGKLCVRGKYTCSERQIKPLLHAQLC